jgi:hypothetical protein
MVVEVFRLGSSWLKKCDLSQVCEEGRAWEADLSTEGSDTICRACGH